MITRLTARVIFGPELDLEKVVYFVLALAWLSMT